MKITPVDVAHKTFNKSIYGLDPKEVFSYLQSIADQLEMLFKERNDLREKLREKEIQIAEYKERDQLLKNTLTTASQMSDRIREDSEKKAEVILHEAYLKSQEMQRDTQESLRRAHAELSELKNIRLQFETNIRALAHAHLSLVEEGQRYMGFPQTTVTGTMTSNHAPGDGNPSDKLTSAISPLAADII
jgi:cell division initiation protein